MKINKHLYSMSFMIINQSLNYIFLLFILLFDNYELCFRINQTISFYHRNNFNYIITFLSQVLYFLIRFFGQKYSYLFIHEIFFFIVLLLFFINLKIQKINFKFMNLLIYFYNSCFFHFCGILFLLREIDNLIILRAKKLTPDEFMTAYQKENNCLVTHYDIIDFHKINNDYWYIFNPITKNKSNFYIQNEEIFLLFGQLKQENDINIYWMVTKTKVLKDFQLLVSKINLKYKHKIFVVNNQNINTRYTSFVFIRSFDEIKPNKNKKFNSLSNEPNFIISKFGNLRYLFID